MRAALINGPKIATFKWDCPGVCVGYVLVGKIDISEKPTGDGFKTHKIAFARNYWEILINQGWKRAPDESTYKYTQEMLDEFGDLEAYRKAYMQAYDKAQANK